MRRHSSYARTGQAPIKPCYYPTPKQQECPKCAALWPKYDWLSQACGCGYVAPLYKRNFEPGLAPVPGSIKPW